MSPIANALVAPSTSEPTASDALTSRSLSQPGRMGLSLPDRMGVSQPDVMPG
jgi:hypothetical protein